MQKELTGRRLKNRTTCRLVKIGYSCRLTKVHLSIIVKILDVILLVYNVTEPTNNVICRIFLITNKQMNEHPVIKVLLIIY